MPCEACMALCKNRGYRKKGVEDIYVLGNLLAASKLRRKMYLKQMTRIFDVWHHDNVEQYRPTKNPDGGLFTQYVDTFMKMKLFDYLGVNVHQHSIQDHQFQLGGALERFRAAYPFYYRHQGAGVDPNNSTLYNGILPKSHHPDWLVR
uniref:Uncharacterized protein n=1 Tax=Romanomermis culicivorax TaxID=13658 RepID=A0A915JXA7_ROMCU